MQPEVRSSLKIHTLGGLLLEEKGIPLKGFVSHKAEALLVYLICHPKQHPREVLAALLWDHSDTAQSLKNLRVVLSSLQKQLSPYLSVTRQSIGVNPDATLWFDVQEFENSLVALQPYIGTTHPPSRVLDQLNQTLNLYKGDFLIGLNLRDCEQFNDWILLEQQRLRNLVADALYQYTEWAIALGDFTNGIHLANRLLAIDPLWEKAQQQLIRLLAYSGRRAAALEQYEIYAERLVGELDIRPEPETTQLYQQIKTGEVKTIEPVPLPPHKLPVPVTPFVDRPQDVDAVQRQLDNPECRLLTLVGVGGAGKTRLALEIASQNLRGFRDGVFYVPLAGVEHAALIPQIIETALGMSTKTGAQTSAEQVIGYLSEKHLLLVLDNFEQILTGADFIADVLANALEVKIMATSQQPLKLREEWTHTISGFSVPDEQRAAEDSSAVRLFAQSAVRILPNFSLTDSLTDVIRICKLVQGLPLALEICATWVDTLTTAQIADQLERRLDLLNASYRGVPDRHRGIRASFDYALSRLAVDEQAAWLKLSVFRGGFDAEAAASVARVTVPLLNRFKEQSLIQPGGDDRFDIHELLKRYAREALRVEKQLGEIEAAHCTYFIQKLHRFQEAPDVSDYEYYEQIEIDYDNLLFALNWALDAGEEDVFLELVELVSTYWTEREYISAGAYWLTRAFDVAQDKPASKRKAIIYLRTAKIAFFQSDYERAYDLFEASRQMLVAAGEEQQVVGILNYLGHMALDQGDTERAAEHYQNLLTLAQQLGNELAQAAAVGSLGDLEMDKGNYAQAHDYFQQALVIFRRLDHANTGAILNNLAVVALKQQDYARAEEYLGESLEYARRAKTAVPIAVGLANLGEVAHLRGDLQRAKQLYQESLKLKLELDDKRRIAIQLEDLAKLAVDLEAPGPATCLFAASRHLRDQIGTPVKEYNLPEYQAALAAIHEQLSEDEFDSLWHDGSEMSLEQAVDLAFSL